MLLTDNTVLYTVDYHLVYILILYLIWVEPLIIAYVILAPGFQAILSTKTIE